MAGLKVNKCEGPFTPAPSQLDAALQAQARGEVYAPPGRWHRASSADGQTGTRLAIIARPRNMHNYAADAGARQ